MLSLEHDGIGTDQQQQHIAMNFEMEEQKRERIAEKSMAYAHRNPYVRREAHVHP